MVSQPDIYSQLLTWYRCFESLITVIRNSNIKNCELSFWPAKFLFLSLFTRMSGSQSLASSTIASCWVRWPKMLGMIVISYGISLHSGLVIGSQRPLSCSPASPPSRDENRGAAEISSQAVEISNTMTTSVGHILADSNADQPSAILYKIVYQTGENAI